MASTEEIVQRLPDTLPEDFGEWDGEAACAADPGNAGGFRSAPAISEPPMSLRQSAEREEFMSALVDRPRGRSVSSAPVFLKQEKLARGIADDRASQKQEPSIAANKAPLAPSRSDDNLVEELRLASKLKAKVKRGAEEDSEAADWPYSASAAKKRSNSEFKETASREASVASRPMFQQKLEVVGDIELEEDQKPSKKKRLIIEIAGGCAALLLIVFMIVLFHPGAKSQAKQSVQPLPVATTTQVSASAPAPLVSTPATQNQTPAAAGAQPKTDSQQADKQTDARPVQVQSQMMNDQLNAPVLIPKDVKHQVAESTLPPSGFGSGGMEELNSGANVGVFKGQGQTVVKAAPSKPVVVSAGVATGMLIKKTAPVYPSIAKTARVSGTVQLAAIISKTGAIENVHVVSGPDMLRQAAIDAVRNWQYRPYKLNNEPTEVETTINVIFSLGG